MAWFGEEVSDLGRRQLGHGPTLLVGVRCASGSIETVEADGSISAVSLCLVHRVVSKHDGGVDAGSQRCNRHAAGDRHRHLVDKNGAGSFANLVGEYGALGPIGSCEQDNELLTADAIEGGSRGEGVPVDWNELEDRTVDAAGGEATHADVQR